ncbi:hypothetical protein K440DRAFT_644016 [Wilcoxina mikolae CBS 423.85]|nr:hypothetical protein K440DRAFT_644016 [Wilcoxina mikolae CBS 423.85]
MQSKYGPKNVPQPAGAYRPWHSPARSNPKPDQIDRLGTLVIIDSISLHPVVFLLIVIDSISLLLIVIIDTISPLPIVTVVFSVFIAVLPLSDAPRNVIPAFLFFGAAFLLISAVFSDPF